MKKIKIFCRYLTRLIPLENNFKDYNSYWRSRGFNAPSLKRAEIISKHLSVNKKILDIGCGDGTIIKYLSEKNSPSKIMGIDISSFAVDYVRKQGYNAEVINILGDDFEHFLEMNKFDYIIITEVLEHIQEPEKVIEDLKKYNPDAVLFISIPNTGFIMHRLRLLFGKFPLVMINEHIKEHIRFWTNSDFKYWIGYFGYCLEGLYVSSTIKIMGSDLGKIYPSLFGQQIIYKIKKSEK